MGFPGKLNKAHRTFSKIHKSWHFDILMLKIMKSGFYYTNLKQKNIKLLNLLFNSIFHRNGTIFVHRLAARPLMANTQIIVRIHDWTKTSLPGKPECLQYYLYGGVLDMSNPRFLTISSFLSGSQYRSSLQ